MMAVTSVAWKDRATDLRPVGQAFIDGEYQDAHSGCVLECISPLSGTVLTSVAACDSHDVDLAVSAARRAFESGVWSRLAPAVRKKALLQFAEAIRSEREKLALLITLDCGKPITPALAEVDGAATCIAFYAEAIDKVFGEVAPTSDAALALVTREPMGVVAAVVPWNFPLGMPSWKIGPALAAGNSVIVKPAEQAPLILIELARLAAEAGVPDGVFNVVPGLGEEAGAALGLHPDVDKIAFTGSTEAGKLFLGYSAQSNMKAVSLECGGKSPNIVLADAPDMERAAADAAAGAFFNQGEMCSAGTRLILEQGIKDDFIPLLVEKTRDWEPSDPLEETTKMGAIVDQEQFDRVLRYIDVGVEEGAVIANGGTQSLPETGGYFIDPTIFTDVVNNMRIAREEIFGPVLSVITVSDADEAVQVANDTKYGLAAAVWTRDVAKAHRISRALRAGSVWVNCYNRSDINVPFGGYKESGFGRDKSLHALEKYTQLKTTWVSLD
jgi:gamma-glutamyl-gamma-aminobutyraldehyde dehydrogenase/4-guanidinobutyraldehyde dehydrogenase/NAD-dependent aldehyde dehydrogenase